MLSLQKWHPGWTATTRARLAPAGTTSLSWAYFSPFSICGMLPGPAACFGKNWLRISTTAAIAQTMMMAMFAAVSSVLFFWGTGLLMAIGFSPGADSVRASPALQRLAKEGSTPPFGEARIDSAGETLQRTHRGGTWQDLAGSVNQR